MFQVVKIGEDSVVRESVIMSDVIIGKNVRIERAIVGPGTIVADNTVIKPEQGSDEVILVTEES